MIKIIGAGLAGCESAYYLAEQGQKVTLYEMRPEKLTPAHKTGNLAELVCSNSLRSDSLQNAVGILKREMEMNKSLIMAAARHSAIPAGGSLAVDRELFSQYIEHIISNHPNITVVRKEVNELNPDELTIIASGPLTSSPLTKEIERLYGEMDLNFFDAIAPIVSLDSIDMSKAYLKNRYDKGEPAYINCPMNAVEYKTFHQFLVNAETVAPKDFEKNVFEGCMPIEVMAKRGFETLLYGPLKPVGLEHEGERPFAVVQLRQDDFSATMYNLVGFQTSLKWNEQAALLKLIPGLENVKILRYGVIHSNVYLESPKHLNHNFQSKSFQNLYFAGQISGVEGYVESAASGLMTAISIINRLNENAEDIPTETIMGSLARYISTPNHHFVPMNANFGILPPLDFKHAKKERKTLYANRAIKAMEDYLSRL